MKYRKKSAGYLSGAFFMRYYFLKSIYDIE